MAVETFDGIYGRLSADEKKLLDNLFVKEPELKKGWLRQDDFSRQQNEMKAKQTEYEEAVAYKAKMEPWSGKVYSTLEAVSEKGWFDIDAGEEHFTEKYTAIEKELEAAKAAALAGGDVDPKKLDELVTAKVQEIAKAAGGLTREEATALYQAESKKLVDEGFKAREAEFNTKTIPWIADFSSQVSIVAAHFEAESGEKWDPKKKDELFKLMNDTQKFNALELEEQFMAPIRDKKKRDEEIEKRAQEIAREKYGAGHGTPGSGNERFIPQPPGGDARGLLQKALEESAGGDKGPKDVRDLVREGVVEGAKELEAAGKF